MDEQSRKDGLFLQMMSRGKLTINNDHFEKDLLNRIEYESWKQKSFAKNRICSIIFFVLGIFMSLWKFDFIIESIQFMLDISISNSLFLFQIISVLFILFQLNSILKLIFKH